MSLTHHIRPMNVQLEKILTIGGAAIIGTSFIATTDAEAVTLGTCPNRGDRCYIEMNGNFNYQPNEEPYFASGWKDAARWYASRGGQYINRQPDYCAF